MTEGKSSRRRKRRIPQEIYIYKSKKQKYVNSIDWFLA